MRNSKEYFSVSIFAFIRNICNICVRCLVCYILQFTHCGLNGRINDHIVEGTYMVDVDGIYPFRCGLGFFRWFCQSVEELPMELFGGFQVCRYSPCLYLTNIVPFYFSGWITWGISPIYSFKPFTIIEVKWFKYDIFNQSKYLYPIQTV